MFKNRPKTRAAIFLMTVGSAAMFHEMGSSLSNCGFTARTVALLFENLWVFFTLAGIHVSLPPACYEHLDLIKLVVPTWTLLRPCLCFLAG